MCALEERGNIKYVVQNSQNFSGLFPSSCIPKKHDVSETGSVSILRLRWGRDTSVGPLRES
jgi:hypothetical protein